MISLYGSLILRNYGIEHCVSVIAGYFITLDNYRHKSGA